LTPEVLQSRAEGRHHGLGVPFAGGGVLTFYRRDACLPSHAHDETHVWVLLDGLARYRTPDQEHGLRPGAVVVVQAGHPHANRFGERGATCLNLPAPPSLDGPGGPVARLSGGLHADLIGLALDAAAGAALDRLDSETLVAEALACAGREPFRAGTIERVVEALEDNPCRPWTLGELGVLVDRHPTHLARAFRKATGLSIGAYRRRRRLLSVCRSLRQDRDSLADIALAHGYSDQAHMTREVARALGSPPGAWRRARRC